LFRPRRPPARAPLRCVAPSPSDPPPPLPPRRTPLKGHRQSPPGALSLFRSDRATSTPLLSSVPRRTDPSHLRPPKAHRSPSPQVNATLTAPLRPSHSPATSGELPPPSPSPATSPHCAGVRHENLLQPRPPTSPCATAPPGARAPCGDRMSSTRAPRTDIVGWPIDGDAGPGQSAWSRVPIGSAGRWPMRPKVAGRILAQRLVLFSFSFQFNKIHRN
jgi:hypothetical protein